MNVSSNPFGTPDPSLNLLVTDNQRDRVTEFLQQAYADGRIDRLDFDNRVDQALSARTREDLNRAYDGIAHLPLASTAIRPAAYRQLPVAGSTAAAGLAHWLAVPAPILGPLAIYLFAARGTPTRREAAKSLNFNVVMMGLIMVLGIASNFVSMLNPITGFATLVWVMVNVVAGLKAYNGEDWTDPISARVGFRVVNPDADRRELPR